MHYKMAMFSVVGCVQFRTYVVLRIRTSLEDSNQARSGMVTILLGETLTDWLVGLAHKYPSDFWLNKKSKFQAYDFRTHLKTTCCKKETSKVDITTDTFTPDLMSRSKLVGCHQYFHGVRRSRTVRFRSSIYIPHSSDSSYILNCTRAHKGPLIYTAAIHAIDVDTGNIWTTRTSSEVAETPVK